MSHTQRGPPPLHRLTGPALTPSARDPSPSLVAPLVRAARLHRHASGNSRGPTQVMHGPPYIFDPLLQASSFPPRTHLSLSLSSSRVYLSPLSAVCRLALPCLPPPLAAPRANQETRRVCASKHILDRARRVATSVIVSVYRVTAMQ